MGSLITRWEFPSRRLSKVSQRSCLSVATDMKIVSPDGQSVLTRCIDLVGVDEENAEEAGIDPMLGQSDPDTSKQ